uniref:Uncharacterized protein n=1 Tax=Ditylenchus dipsaci TaxID=166011 RepID=A0A915DBJ7_9BILA
MESRIRNQGVILDDYLSHHSQPAELGESSSAVSQIKNFTSAVSLSRLMAELRLSRLRTPPGKNSNRYKLLPDTARLAVIMGNRVYHQEAFLQLPCVFTFRKMLSS